MLESAYIVLLFLIAFIEIVRKKSHNFDFLTLFNIYFSLLYPLPGFLLAFDFENSASDLGVGISLYTNNIQTALAIFAGYFFVIIGFYSKSAQRFGKNIIIKPRKNNLIVFVYAILLLLFSCLSIYIYSSQFGGFLTTLASTALRRAQALEGGNLVFFARLTLFSIWASYLLCSLAFIKKIKKAKIFIYITCVFSVIVAVIAVTMTGGRAYVINYFVAFYLVYLIKNKKPLWGVIIFIIVSGILFLFYGKPLFFSLTALPDGYVAVVDRFLNSIENDSGKDFSFYNFMHNFHYPVYSLDVAFSKDYQMRWFVDFIYAFASLIPDRFLGTTPIESITPYNTKYIIGNFDFAIPTGFLAFGIYSMWWPGLIVVCFTYGWIGRYLQTILNNHIHDIFWMPFLYTVVAQMWMDFLGSDPETFLQSYFCSLTAGICLICIASKVFIVRQRQV